MFLGQSCCGMLFAVCYVVVTDKDGLFLAIDTKWFVLLIFTCLGVAINTLVRFTLYNL